MITHKAMMMMMIIIIIIIIHHLTECSLAPSSYSAAQGIMCCYENKNLIIYHLTPWTRVIIDKLIVTQLVNNV